MAALPSVVREMREWLMHAERPDGTQTIAHADVSVRDWAQRLGGAMLDDALASTTPPTPSAGVSEADIVQAVAVAIAEATDDTKWYQLHDDIKDIYRTQARAALAAAEGVK